MSKLSKDSTLSQRDLSKELGLSLGKVNYALSSLIGKGFIKVQRFKNAKKRIAYMYIMTPEGIKKKMELTRELLIRKIDEFDALKMEIEELREEIGNE